MQTAGELIARCSKLTTPLPQARCVPALATCSIDSMLRQRNECPRGEGLLQLVSISAHFDSFSRCEFCPSQTEFLVPTYDVHCTVRL